MQVMIGGKKVTLNAKDVVGTGGEGTVFVNASQAIKVYHTPSTVRENKLKAFMTHNWQLPTAKVAVPQELVYDAKGKSVIGLTMPYLGTGFEEVASLSNKKYRASLGVTTRDVATIFLDGRGVLETIHQNGLVVGDLNDLNVLFRGREMLWIDVDAWQFDRYPCMVATENFIAPELYGIDLAQKPVFKPEHDWYSFAVMLFKSILLVHPYGGVHKTERRVTTRAQKHISILDKAVIYPTIGYGIDLLDQRMLEVFEKYFVRGERVSFPKDILQAYLDSLTICPSCGMHYPATRKACPVCSAQTLVFVPTPQVSAAGVTITQLVQIQGQIIRVKIFGEKIYILVRNQGQVELHSLITGHKEHKVLWNDIPGARYDMLDGVVFAVMPDGEVLVVDITGQTPAAIAKTETGMFAITRRSVFHCGEDEYYRLAGATLVRGIIDPRTGAPLEYPLRNIAMNQTWFTASEHNINGTRALFGLSQSLTRQFYWMIRAEEVMDVTLEELDPGEVVLDISVKFSSQGALIRRLTQSGGVNYLRTEVVNEHGVVTFTAPKIRAEDHPVGVLHGEAYTTGVLVHATDEGVVQERVTDNIIKSFPDTRGHVQAGNTLHLYKGGLLVIGEREVKQLTIR